jgi:hypothetical protein
MTARIRFVVVLEAMAGGDRMPLHALRSLLKRLLRSRPSLRCVSAQQVVDHHDADPLHHNNDGGKR